MPGKEVACVPLTSSRGADYPVAASRSDGSSCRRRSCSLRIPATEGSMPRQPTLARSSTAQTR
jgi:hypothetical protein